MKNVIVLLENENKTYPILKSLGVNDPSSLQYLCRQRTAYEDALLARGPVTHFVFETFGLFNQTPKVRDLISSKDGAIVIFSYSSLSVEPHKFINRIQQLKCRPLLVLIGDTPSADSKKYLLSSSATFRVEYLGSDDCRESLATYNAQQVVDAWFIPELNAASVPRVTANEMTSKTIGSKEMMKEFENCTLPMTLWDHFGRLRVVFLSLTKFGYENTIDPNGWLCSNWKKYKMSIGHAHLWNYSLTRLWVNIIVKAIRNTASSNFDELYQRNPHLSNGKLHMQYYTSDVLFTDQARNSYVPPNLTVATSKASNNCIIS